MKNIFALTFIILIFSIISQADQFGASTSGHTEILNDIKSEVKKCVVMSISKNLEHTIVRSFESTCKTLVLVSEKQAQIYLENSWFTATIAESSDSDGGDLDNMLLRDSNGKIVAERNNVPAFDSIVFAMTGGDQKLRIKNLN